VIAACIATLIVLVIPGAVVARLLGLPFGSLRTWAAVPGISFATVFVIAEFTLVTRLPFTALTACIAVAALAVAAFVRVRTERHSVDIDPPRRDLANVIAFALLGLGIAVGLGTWAVGISGHDLVPPSSDAAYHGFFVARIMDTHSIDIAKIAVSDPAGIHHVVSYYPLAMHASAAVAAQLTGADIGRVLVAFTVLFSALILPLGMFVLARMLAPRSPLIAGFTALVVPAVALFPYAPIQFGDVPIIVGMALVPATVVLATDAIASPDDAPGIRVDAVVAAALGVLAVVAVHSSQLPLTIALVALLVIERAVLTRSAQFLGRALRRGLIVSAVGIVLFAPSLGSFARGVSERSGFDNTPTFPLHDVIGPALGLDSGAFDHPTRQVLLALLAAVGVVIWLLRRRFAWVVGLALVVSVMVFAAVSDNRLSQALSLPWYRGPTRIGWNRAFFIPFFAGVALAGAVTAVGRAGKNRRRSVVIATIAAVVMSGAVFGYRGYDTSSDLLRSSFSHNALVTSESEAAFAWLHRHARPGDTILNDVNSLGITTDDSVWMYAQRRLRPLFGFAQSTNTGFALPNRAAQRDLRDRMFLLKHLRLLDRSRRVQQLARRYRVRWVYFDERTITVFRNTLDLAGLLANPHLRPVFRRGPVHVFELEQ
jgi:hypothetical protein